MRIKSLLGALTLACVAAACGSSNAPSSGQPTPSSKPPSSATSDTAMPAMNHGDTSVTDTAAGAVPSDTMDMSHEPAATGLSIKLTARTFDSAKRADLAFQIITADKTPVTSYQIEQTKELHLVLVRSDLTGYQHLHPTRGSDGTWTIPVTFAKGGTYRMVADFVPVLDGAAAGRTAVTADLSVSGAGADTALPLPSTTAIVDGYTVTVRGSLGSVAESTLSFTVVDSAGAATKLEPYLGAFGHLVAFDVSDLAYTHIHPSAADKTNGTLDFVGQVAAPGLHRLFMQFSAGGAVHTAEFTINAE